ASYHYSYYTSGEFYIVRSRLVDTLNGSSTFERLNSETSFSGSGSHPAFEQSASRVFVVASAETDSVYHVPKTGGELTVVEDSWTFLVRDVGIAVDDEAVFGVQANAVVRFPVDVGAPTPIAALLEGETPSSIAVTDDDVILASDVRLSMT